MITTPPEASAVPPPLPGPAVAPVVISPASPRTIRLVELALLLAVAFGSSLYAAVFISLGGSPPSTSYPHRWIYSLIHELTALALCAYLLHKQGRSFRQLGMDFHWSDPFSGFGIMILGLTATYLVTYSLYLHGYYSVAARASQSAAASMVLGEGFVWGMVVFTVINGLFEEFIARAYLMTDVTFLSGSTTLAVVISAVFQGAYHLYQGWQAALSVTMGFLVFSLIYAKTRRVTPLVFAHVIWDLWILAGYTYTRQHSVR